MRKYYQVALAIVAIISLVSLVIYRHEYNRLRYVLEVLNYFGTPGDKGSHINCTNNAPKLNHSSFAYGNNRFDEPLSSWQRINDDVYIYSAYAVNDGEIRALGFAKAGQLNVLSCYIYYENNVEPVTGKLIHEAIESSESVIEAKGLYRAYHLICSREKNNAAIVGVSFPNRVRKQSGDAVILSVKNLNDRYDENNNEIALCVAPSSSHPILEMDIVNFISFHNSFGINHFVVYDFGIPQRFNAKFKEMSRELNVEFNITYTVIPWNFPFAEISLETVRRIIQTDCLYRTYKKVKFVGVLTWDEYIVMKYHRTLQKLFKDMDNSELIGERYELSSYNFCILNEMKKSYDNSAPQIFSDKKIAENRSVYIYRTTGTKSVLNHKKIVTRETTPDVIAVNRYERQCDRRFEPVALGDRYVGKFSKDIMNLAIYKRFIS